MNRLPVIISLHILYVIDYHHDARCTADDLGEVVDLFMGR
jgi:hypothetical protein